MLFKVTLIFPQEVEGDRPFNLVTHFYKPIKALKCDQGSPQIYSNRWSMCKKEKVQKYHSEDVVILQKVSQVKSEGFICQKYESTIDELCGMFSYSKVVDLKIDTPVNISIEECETIRDQGYIMGPGGFKHKIGQNSEIHYSYIRNGQMLFKPDNIWCNSNKQVMIGEIPMEGVITLVSARVKFLRVPILESAHDRIDEHHGKQLPTGCLQSRGCESSFGTYLFDSKTYFDGFCLYQKIRRVEMKSTVKDEKKYLISDKHHILLESRKQIKYPSLFKQTERYKQRSSHCLDQADLMTTQFDNIYFVSNATNPGADLKWGDDLKEVDGNNYSPELQKKINMHYQTYSLTQMIEETFTSYNEKLCEAVMRSSSEILRSPFHKDSLIKKTADVISEMKCRGVYVSIRVGMPEEKCYSDFVVARAYNSTEGVATRIYVHLQTRLIFEKEPPYISEVRCDSATQQYLISKDNSVIGIYPYPRIIHNMSLNHRDISIWEEKSHFHPDFEDYNGLYTNDEMTSYHQDIIDRSGEDAVEQIISENFCGNEFCGSTNPGTSHPDIRSWDQILFSPLVGFSHKILSFFRVFGEISAVFIGIFVLTRFIYICGRRFKGKYLEVYDQEECAQEVGPIETF